MSENIKIDYLNWANQKAVELAKKVDKDGIKGLQGKEVSAFMRSAIDNNISKDDVYELMGVSLSKTRAAQLRAPRQKNPDFDKAVNYYNDKMNINQRSAVTEATYTNLETRLYNMEKAINQAYIDCDAYSDIMIMPRWHYRYYPYFEDKLLNFNIDEIRTRTTADMESLHQLKDKVEYIMEDANGETTHNEPQKTQYDVEALAQKHLGMSYAEFAEQYKEELEFCKTVTYADLASMNQTQRTVYAKAKAYAKEMLTITITEAHTVNWDVGERKLDETMKATGDMYAISDFEYDGITEQGLSELKSGIMYKAFEEALINKYRELEPSGINEVSAEPTQKTPIKRVVNGVVLIFNPDGSIYDLKGNKIK